MRSTLSDPSRLLVPSMLILLIAALMPTASAGTPAAPEMPDAEGDVDPRTVLGLGDLAPEARGNLSMFDIKRAYVTAETANAFVFVIDVVDMDGGLQPPAGPAPIAPPSGPTHFADYDIHFETPQGSWIARATLEPWYYVDPATEPPTAVAALSTNFTLHQDDADETLIGRISGYAFPQLETIWMVVPKASIGAPEPGQSMDSMYAVSKFRGAPLDYAPDALLDPSAADAADPLGTLLAPHFGTTYEFGQYAGSGAPPKLALTPQGETTASAATGEPVELALSIENSGQQPLDVRFSTQDPTGWSITLSAPTLTLEAGSSDVVVITATPSDKARGQGILRITASTAAESQSVAYTLKHAAATDPTGAGGDGTDDGTEGPDGPEQSLSDGEDEDTPAPFIVPLVAVLVALAVARRRSA